MKKWIKAMVQRVGDLLIKLVAFKVVAASVVTAIFLAVVVPVAAVAPVFAVVGFLVVAMMWALAVSYRYAEKLSGLVDKARGGEEKT